MKKLTYGNSLITRYFLRNMSRILLSIIFLLTGFGIGFAQYKPVVASDGTGQFTSIQKAIESLPKDNSLQTIYIKNGVYHEKVFIERANITLVGQSTPKYGKWWKEIRKSLKDKVDGVYILASISRDIFRCDHPDDWGAAPFNLRANDITIRNITIVNTFGFDLEKEYNFECNGETRKIRKDGHQFAFRTMPPTQRLTVDHCNFYSLGGDTVSPWDVENGTYSFTNCTMEGGVDLYCPRGWAYAEKCYFICHNKNAAVWHDGTGNESAKSVIKNSSFVGENQFKLGRYHRDAQIYLINCTYSDSMANSPIYQVTIQNTLEWGQRIFYYNRNKKNIRFDWLNNNISAIQAKSITKEYVLNEKWYNPKPYVKTTDYAMPIKVTIEMDSIAERMMMAQRNYGGWAKTLDGKTQPPDYNSSWSPETIATITDDKGRNDGTIDNGATTRELKYLIGAYRRTNNHNYLEAIKLGISYLLEMQYPNGGFPQFYPDTSGYRKHITFNDDAMVNVLRFLKTIGEQNPDTLTIDKELIIRVKSAYLKGIDCILNLQLEHNGLKTAWAAQYDKYQLKPAKARAYEHPSYAISESVGICKFLLEIDNPSIEVITAIKSANLFFNKVKIDGFDYERIVTPNTESKKEIALTPNPKAKPLWARFYDLNTLQPMFSGRDGVIKHDIFEIENERRVNYGWYGYWPDDFVEKLYPRWHKKYIGDRLDGLTKIADRSYNIEKVKSDIFKKYPFAKIAVANAANTLLIKDIDYCEVDSMILKMDVIKPTINSNRIPIILIHGGGWRSGDKSDLRVLATSLATKGFTCFLPQYRLSTHALYPAPLADIRSAIDYINKNSGEYQIDTEKLAAVGFSAGGQLATLLGNTNEITNFNGMKISKTLPVKTVVDIDGILAFVHPESGEGDDSKRTSASTNWFGANKYERPDLYLEASALTYASASSPAILFIASSEPRMSAGWTDYKAKLDQNDIKNEYYKFDGAPHNFIYCEPWFTPLVDRVASFILNISSNKN